MNVRFSISLKLLLLILPLICLPIASTGYFSIHAAVDRVNRLVRHEQMSKVSAAAEKLSYLFEKLRIDLETITTLPVMEDHFISRSFRLRAETEFNRETITRLFQDFIDRTPYYRQIQYLDEFGTELIRVDADSATDAPGDGNAYPFFSQTRHLMSGQVFISDVEGGKNGRPSVMHWSKPVFSAMREFTGVVVIDLNFDRIIHIIKDIHVGETGYAFLADQQGRIVVHPRFTPYSHTQQNVAEPSLKQMLEKMMTGATSWEQYRFDGKLKVAAISPISPIGWSIAVTIPTAEFKKEARAIQRRVLQVVGMTLVIAIVSVSILSYLILRPVRNLVAVTHQISADDLNQELPVHSHDELGDLTRSFNRMIKNLARTQNELVRSEKLISLGRLSAGMAHEIRNPLNAIKGAMVHLKRRRPDDHLVQEYTQLVSEEIDRLNHLVTDFLYFSKQAKPRPAPTDLNQLILSVQQLFAEQAKKSNIRFTNHLADGLPSVRLDMQQIEQVVVNLLVNAMDALPKGGVVSFSTVLLPSADGTGDRVRVEICDDGIGIPEAHLQSIFDPFFSTKESGSGIGLPLSLGIIENHGGTLVVSSKPSLVTLAAFELPVNSLLFSEEINP